MSQSPPINLSFTRLTKFETCPLAYRLAYIDRVRAEPGVPARFGRAVHSVLERLLREAIEQERIGKLPEERAWELLRQAWAAESLSGVKLYEEAIRMVQHFIAAEGVVDPRNVLAIEREFRIVVGEFTVIGVLDRVNRIDDQTVEVVDYKSNYQLFSSDQVESSLQLSLYHVAAQHLWPWAKRVQLTFDMLRHGVRQRTSRTPEELEVALGYVQALGHQMQNAARYAPRLGPGCAYCDYREQCPAYADALAGKRSFVSAASDDLEVVAREREAVAAHAKVLSARKRELDEVLERHLQDREELVLAGTKYRLLSARSYDYPVEPSLSILARVTGKSKPELLARLGALSNEALRDLLAEHAEKTDRAHAAMLRIELEAHAAERRTTRLLSNAVKVAPQKDDA